MCNLNIGENVWLGIRIGNFLICYNVWSVKFYLLEFIQVQVMLFCVLKWPAWFTRLHFMFGEYFLSLDWALQSVWRHPSLCSSNVTYSRVSSPAVKKYSLYLWQWAIKAVLQNCMFFFFGYQVYDIHFAYNIKSYIFYSVSSLCKCNIISELL